MSELRRDFSLIVARSLLRLLEDETPSLTGALDNLEAAGVVRRFPDGSVFVEGREGVARFYQEAYGGSPRSGHLRGSHIFRSVAAFPPMLYQIDFPKPYYEALMPTGFVVANVPGSQYAGEDHPEELAVSVGFKRKLNQGVRDRFTSLVERWYATVRNTGVFGEGPIRAISPDVEFQGLRALFRVDGRLSGQHTLNWFTLQALDFGLNDFPTRLVGFGQEDYWEHWFGPSKGGVTRIPLSG